MCGLLVSFFIFVCDGSSVPRTPGMDDPEAHGVGSLAQGEQFADLPSNPPDLEPAPPCLGTSSV